MLIECENFDFDVLKNLFNGRVVRGRAVRNGGNDTDESPFRGSIVISQNSTVDASEAILTRICHITLDRSRHSQESATLAKELERMPMEEVSNFVVQALRMEKQIMETFEEKQSGYFQMLLSHPEIKQNRIARCHAQLLSLFQALGHLISFTSEQREAVAAEILNMALERQQCIANDHKIVQEFWERFDYLDEGAIGPRLNHSRNPGEIAVNLNHFQEIAAERRLQVPTLSELR